MSVEFTCKCIACGKRFVLTERQLKEASDVGCAISPCCGFPSTVVNVEHSAAGLPGHKPPRDWFENANRRGFTDADA